VGKIMARFKLVLLLLAAVLLVIFAMENRAYPNPPISLLGFAFLPLPHFLIIYTSLTIGFLAGWFAHVLKVKRRRREALAEAQEAAAAETPHE